MNGRAIPGAYLSVCMCVSANKCDFGTNYFRYLRYHCTYSIRYYSRKWLPAGVLVELEPRHQPVATWVNTTRYFKYSQVLLMMDENIVRNM
jgi:hypothetical protein